MRIQNKDDSKTEPVIICSMLCIWEYRLRKIKVDMLPEDSPASNKNG
jgi:hypothetical protein